MLIRDRSNIVNNKTNSFSCEWFYTSPHFESSLKPSTHSLSLLFILNFFFVELYMPGTASPRVGLTYTILPANTVGALSPCDHSRKRPALVTTTFEKLPLNCYLNIVMKSSRNRPRRDSDKSTL